MGGWIKIYRELLEKPIWLNSTVEQKTILITLLLMANHKEKEWEWKGEKFKAKPGQFVTSLPNITKKCGKGVSIQNVRTAIKRFEKLEFLTNESTKTGRLITIVKWRDYQEEESKANRDNNKELTDNQQRINRELTSNKNDKNDKKEKNNILYVEIIEYLNEKANTRFQSTTKSTQKLINARINDGYTIEDIKIVIDKKVAEWINTEMQKYLRPQTLFGSKFEGYLNQRGGKSSGDNSNKQINELDEWMEGI